MGGSICGQQAEVRCGLIIIMQRMAHVFGLYSQPALWTLYLTFLSTVLGRGAESIGQCPLLILCVNEGNSNLGGFQTLDSLGLWNAFHNMKKKMRTFTSTFCPGYESISMR